MLVLSRSEYFPIACRMCHPWRALATTLHSALPPDAPESSTSRARCTAEKSRLILCGSGAAGPVGQTVIACRERPARLRSWMPRRSAPPDTSKAPFPPRPMTSACWIPGEHILILGGTNPSKPGSEMTQIRYTLPINSCGCQVRSGRNRHLRGLHTIRRQYRPLRHQVVHWGRRHEDGDNIRARHELHHELDHCHAGFPAAASMINM